jgi:hypothetical protein
MSNLILVLGSKDNLGKDNIKSRKIKKHKDLRQFVIFIFV